MKTKHTKEPWVFIPQNLYGDAAIVNNNHDVNCHVLICKVKMPYHNEKEYSLDITKSEAKKLIDEKNANGARIVACVNAMKDIDDPLDFIKKVDESFKEVIKMKQQRDKLKETLSLLLGSLPTYMEQSYYVKQAKQQLKNIQS